jgi:hypothetical protein
MAPSLSRHRQRSLLRPPFPVVGNFTIGNVYPQAPTHFCDSGAADFFVAAALRPAAPRPFAAAVGGLLCGPCRVDEALQVAQEEDTPGPWDWPVHRKYNRLGERLP